MTRQFAQVSAPATRPAAGPRPQYTVALPAGLGLINSNQRLHRHEVARRTSVLRAAAKTAALSLLNPDMADAIRTARPGVVFERAHILGILRPGSTARRDPANWYPSFKAAVDGLVDAGVLEDDDHTHLIGPDMRLGSKAARGQLVLVIRGLAPGEDWPNLGQVIA